MHNIVINYSILWPKVCLTICEVEVEILAFVIYIFNVSPLEYLINETSTLNIPVRDMKTIFVSRKAYMYLLKIFKLL